MRLLKPLLIAAAALAVAAPAANALAAPYYGHDARGEYAHGYGRHRDHVRTYYSHGYGRYAYRHRAYR